MRNLVVEFDRKHVSVQTYTLEEITLRYDDSVLKTLQEDGSAFVSNDVEIHLEGCYHPAIVLTLDK